MTDCLFHARVPETHGLSVVGSLVPCCKRPNSVTEEVYILIFMTGDAFATDDRRMKSSRTVVKNSEAVSAYHRASYPLVAAWCHFLVICDRQTCRPCRRSKICCRLCLAPAQPQCPCLPLYADVGRVLRCACAYPLIVETHPAGYDPGSWVLRQFCWCLKQRGWKPRPSVCGRWDRQQGVPCSEWVGGGIATWT